MKTLSDKIVEDVARFIIEHDISVFDADKDEFIRELNKTISEHILNSLE